MDALWEWMEFVGTLSWLPHGCSVGMDRVCGNVIMVATWMHCGNGWSLLWTLSWLGHGCSARMDRVCGNVIMVATWMLCGNGWSLWERYHGCHMDALWEWIEFVGTSSWLPHGCSVGMDGVSSGRYHGWDMDALPEWMEFVGTLSGLPHGCSAGMDGVCGNVIMVATWMLCGNG